MIDEFLEALADLEHQQWCAWARGTIDDVPAERAERWKRLLVPYEELDERDKQADRVFAERVIKLLQARKASVEALLQIDHENLLKAIGDLAVCKSCGAPIYWVKTKNGKRMPVNAKRPTSHFATCPQANRWRK